MIYSFFVNEKQEAINLLKYISEIIGIKPEERGFSFTEQRIPSMITRRTRPLISVPIRTDLFNETYDVKLTRVVLLINNAALPIILWKRNIN